jgi:hypothetical protein
MELEEFTVRSDYSHFQTTGIPSVKIYFKIKLDQND